MIIKDTSLGETNLAAFQLEQLNIQQAIHILRKLSGSWSKRAQVKSVHIFDALQFDLDRDDFLYELLPFQNHPSFIDAPLEVKRKILTCGWVLYNHKTIAIENTIINPICVTILEDKIPGLSSDIAKRSICETMVDEAYHVLLVTNALNLTSQFRAHQFISCSFNLETEMKKLQASYTETWQKHLIHLATAIVSEIFISDYLKLLSDSEHIQPINRVTTKIHREDELAHSNIFRNLSKIFYAHLQPKEKFFFAEILAKPVRWFADREFSVWNHLFSQYGLSHYSDMLRDCQYINEQCLNFIDYSDLVKLAVEIGITDVPIGLASFQHEGLI